MASPKQSPAVALASLSTLRSSTFATLERLLPPSMAENLWLAGSWLSGVIFGALCACAVQRNRSIFFRRRIDYTKSTEENYRKPHYEGEFYDIRPFLDHTYHANYDTDRVKVQDQLICEMLNPGGEQKKLLLPWVVFTAGAMGAGKGYVTRWMEKRGCLPKKQFVIVDPDAIRMKLPEWSTLVGLDSQTAGNLTQKEAGLIAEIMSYAALRERWNLIIDGSLRDAAWYKVYFRKLREKFPGIRIMILHIQADKEEVLRRADARAKETGRAVPRETLLKSMEAVPKSIEALSPHADFVARVFNQDGKEPQLSHQEGAPHPTPDIILNWDLVRRLWEPIDLDGDGELSVQEVKDAIAAGLLTQEVVDTVDTDHDGAISREEIDAAMRTAHKSGSLVWT